MRNVLYRCVWCSKSRIFKLIFSPKDDTMPNYDDWHVPLLFKFIITAVLTFWESLTLRVTWEWCFLAVWCFLACFFPEKSRYILKKYFSNIWPCFWVPKLHFINFTQICWWFVKNTSAHWHHVGLPQLHFFFSIWRYIKGWRLQRLITHNQTNMVKKHWGIPFLQDFKNSALIHMLLNIKS